MLKLLKSAQELTSLINGDKPLLLMASASYCPPCKMFTPIVEEVSNLTEFASIEFAKINLDDIPDANDIVGVGSVPTLIFWKGGKEVYREIGSLKSSYLSSLLTSHLL